MQAQADVFGLKGNVVQRHGTKSANATSSISSIEDLEKETWNGHMRGQTVPLPVEKTRQKIVVPLMVPSASIKKTTQQESSTFPFSQTCYFLNSNVFCPSLVFNGAESSPRPSAARVRK